MIKIKINRTWWSKDTKHKLSENALLTGESETLVKTGGLLDSKAGISTADMVPSDDWMNFKFLKLYIPVDRPTEWI